MISDIKQKYSEKNYSSVTFFTKNFKGLIRDGIWGNRPANNCPILDMGL